MKKTKIIAIVAIVLFSIALGTFVFIKSHQSEQIAQQQYEAEQSSILQSKVEESAKLQSEAEQSEKLQQEADQNEQLQREAEQNTRLQAEAVQQEKLDYEEMCQHIEDISDKLESVSKLLISVNKEFGYDRDAVLNSFYNNENSEEWLEYKSLIEPLRFMREILFVQNKGYTYVSFYYPVLTTSYEYCEIHSEYHYFSKEYYIIYIPDEYMDEASIDGLNVFFNGTMQKIKDNLFIVWFWYMPPFDGCYTL
jgi:hypothetical protein